MALELGEGRVPVWTSMEFEVNPGGQGDYIRSLGAELVGAQRTEAALFDLSASSAYELAPFSYAVGGALALLNLGRSATAFYRVREGEANLGGESL